MRNLQDLEQISTILAVTPPNYGYINVGSIQTQGDALLDFDDVRATLGVDGSGVTVGVISDGIFGLADAIASGDLPATSFNRDGSGKLVSTTGAVIATSFRADGDLEAGLSGPTGSEGTAILEIVHDIAPGAQLRFANFDTSLEFIDAVDLLAANSDVVIDDIGFFQRPYDQTSDVSTNTSDELNRLSNPIRGYYTSVGNQALQHYQELYVNSGTDGLPFVGNPGGLHQFGPTADTSDAMGLDTQIANPIFLANGQTVTVFLVWDDTFGTATTDYDPFLFQNSPFTLVAFGGDDNPGVTGNPTEVLAFTNNTGSGRFYDIIIQNFLDASATKTFDMFIFGGVPFANGTLLNFNTIASSVPAQSDAGGGVISVGAIDAADPGIDDIETFSSRGPTNNGVIKPDVAAIDGVSVTGSGGFPSTFFGTSAAAPHVAGLAALLLAVAPDLTSGELGDDPAADRAALRNAIVNGAVDLGAAGIDNTFGSGRVSGIASAAFVSHLITVTKTADTDDGSCDADCSLREAINAANANAGTDTIAFNISGAGPHTIQPASALPTITDPVIIDGYTQPGASANTNGPRLGLNTVRKIELDGTNAGFKESGLNIQAGNSLVRGLVINRSPRDQIFIGSNGQNVIEGNFIGTDIAGTVDLGSSNGVFIFNSADNTIGGTSTGTSNLLSGNGTGVRIVGASSLGNLVKGNLIGTDSSGSTGLGNGDGIFLFDAGNNAIGGIEPAEPNIIAFNSRGIAVETGISNAFLSNSLFSNGLGIDLGTDGVTPNDAGDGDTGPNNLQNFPVLTSAISGSTTIEGTLNSAANIVFRLEFFSNAACDPSGNGEGETFLGFKDVTTDGTGNVSFTATFATSVTVGHFITATATDPGNNTSEFSQCAVVAPTLQSLAVSPSDTTILVAGTLQFVATGTLSDASTQNLTATVTWASSDTGVATISSSGLASGVAEGTATITATDPTTSISGTATLTVVIPAAVPSLSQWAFIGMAGLFAMVVLVGIGLQGRVRRKAG